MKKSLPTYAHLQTFPSIFIIRLWLFDRRSYGLFDYWRFNKFILSFFRAQLEQLLIEKLIFLQVLQLRFLAIGNQLFISFGFIESDISDDLSKTNGTKFQWIEIVLLYAVETVHEATVVNAVSYAEHMSDFMHHCSHRGIKYQIPIYFLSLSPSELLVPSQKGENSNSRFVLGPPIDKVPTIAGVYVFQSDAHDAVGIFWHSLLHIGQNVLGQVLIPEVVFPFFYLRQFGFKFEHRQTFDQQLGIEQFAKITKFFYESLVKLSELLEIYGFPFRCDLVVVWKFVVGISLMNLFMAIKPISRSRRVHRFKKLAHLRIIFLLFGVLECAKGRAQLLL